MLHNRIRTKNLHEPDITKPCSFFPAEIVVIYLRITDGVSGLRLRKKGAFSCGINL